MLQDNLLKAFNTYTLRMQCIVSRERNFSIYYALKRGDTMAYRKITNTNQALISVKPIYTACANAAEIAKDVKKASSEVQRSTDEIFHWPENLSVNDQSYDSDISNISKKIEDNYNTIIKNLQTIYDDAYTIYKNQDQQRETLKKENKDDNKVVLG